MSKKRCLFLVEGPTDRQRFSILQKLFDKNDLVIVPFQTDVLTNKSYSSRYESHIRAALSKEKVFDLKDFDEIVQIIDTDGCFLPDSLIKVDHDTTSIKYTHNTITCSDLDALIQQRENKRNNIKALLEKKTIKLYYVSTNAEHAFDGLQNPSNKQKRELALKMYSTYSKNLGALIEKIQSITPDVKTFEESWSFIMSDKNSLLSYSNILFWIIDNLEFLKEEFKEYLNTNND